MNMVVEIKFEIIRTFVDGRNTRMNVYSRYKFYVEETKIPLSYCKI